MTNTICIHEDCSTRANFNYKGIKPALYCSKHKLENMVDVNNKIAVKDDFSGSVIYKIYCKDENPELYTFVFINLLLLVT